MRQFYQGIEIPVGGTADVRHFNSMDEYLAIPEVERLAMDKLVIVETDEEANLTADAIPYNDQYSVKEAIDFSFPKEKVTETAVTFSSPGAQTQDFGISTGWRFVYGKISVSNAEITLTIRINGVDVWTRTYYFNGVTGSFDGIYVAIPPNCKLQIYKFHTYNAITSELKIVEFR